jgi:hypothetical protein
MQSFSSVNACILFEHRNHPNNNKTMEENKKYKAKNKTNGEEKKLFVVKKKVT